MGYLALIVSSLNAAFFTFVATRVGTSGKIIGAVFILSNAAVAAQQWSIL